MTREKLGVVLCSTKAGNLERGRGLKITTLILKCKNANRFGIGKNLNFLRQVKVPRMIHKSLLNISSQMCLLSV